MSPYEKDRIISASFGQTEMGRDLLAQDYMLKQLTASMFYPENELGKKFWERVHQKIARQFGDFELPVNTFQKIWIAPDRARVFEHERGVFVVESRLKVMLEEDYLALQKSPGHRGTKSPATTGDLVAGDLVTLITKAIILPEIEREVNEGKNFAPLRQIYSAVILATWYKQALKDSVLGRVYVNRDKTEGIQNHDAQINQKIYDQYLKALKTGVYSYIKESIDPLTQESILRKYFSGGANLRSKVERKEFLSREDSQALQINTRGAVVVQAELAAIPDSVGPLKPLNTETLRTDFLARLIRFESKQYDSASDVYSATVYQIFRIYLAMAQTGYMTRAKLESFLKVDNYNYRHFAVNAVKEYYLLLLRKGESLDISKLLDVLDKDILPIREQVLLALGEIYPEMIRRGYTVDTALIERQFTAEPTMINDHASAVMKKISDAQKGIFAETDTLPKEPAPAADPGDILRQMQAADTDAIIKFLKPLAAALIAQIEQGTNVNADLSGLEKYLNHPNPNVRRNTVGELSNVYIALLRNTPAMKVNQAAYDHWHKNGLFLPGTGLNTRVLSHVFQSSETELATADRWLSQVKEIIMPFANSSDTEWNSVMKNVPAAIYFLELLVPGSSGQVVEILRSHSLSRLKAFLALLTSPRTTETLLYARTHIPRIETHDYFTLLDFMAIFSYLEKPDFVLAQIEKPFKSRNHLYRQLSTGLIDVFQKASAANEDNLKFDFFNKVLDRSAGRVKPYIIRAGLKSSDRFTRRSAAAKAATIPIMIDALKDDLIAALKDPDLSVVSAAAQSLQAIGDERSITILLDLIEGSPKKIILYIFDDHGTIVAYTEKVRMTGITADKFEFRQAREEDNPSIRIFKDTITGIEERIKHRRENKRIDISRIKDKRLVEFFNFLEGHGLEKDIVVVGGGVRDAYLGQDLNDIDINVRVPLTREEHEELIETRSPANERIYNYIIEKLTLLARALNADVNEFLPPTQGKSVQWEGIEIQYTGPVALKVDKETPNGNHTVYLKRIIVGDNGWVYSSNSGAGLLQMALDSTGKIYGHDESLQDLDNGKLHIVGNRDNLALGDIIRMMILKYQFKLLISQEDYEIIELTIPKYLDGELPLESNALKDVLKVQVEKVLTRAIDRKMAEAELKKLGILDLLKQKFGLTFDRAMLAAPAADDTKGGIDLNPGELKFDREGKPPRFEMPVPSPKLLDQLQNIKGFVPNILNITPLPAIPLIQADSTLNTRPDISLRKP